VRCNSCKVETVPSLRICDVSSARHEHADAPYTLGRYACGPSGHVTIAPPRRTMNSRHLTHAPHLHDGTRLSDDFVLSLWRLLRRDSEGRGRDEDYWVKISAANSGCATASSECDEAR
jgi:hypothetical protein